MKLCVKNLRGSRRRFGIAWSGLAVILMAMPGGYAIASAASSHIADCVNGSRRVGTLNDSVLGRQWAVVVSCAHPGWPAHLEPAQAWGALPIWVPAGSRVRVYAGNEQMAMTLIAVTVVPGRVGQKVVVKLKDGARVTAQLTSAQQAKLTPPHRWRQP